MRAWHLAVLPANGRLDFADGWQGTSTDYRLQVH